MVGPYFDLQFDDNVDLVFGKSKRLWSLFSKYTESGLVEVYGSSHHRRRFALACATFRATL